MANFEMDDVDIDLGMTEEQLEELLENGDEEAMAKALGWDDETLEANKGTGDFDVPEEEIEAARQAEQANADEKKGDTDGTPPDAGQKQEQAKPDDEPDDVRKVVKSRDGKHEIPYDVLEAVRDKAKKASSRATELEQNLNGTQAELEEARRLNEQLKKQLEENDLTPGDVLQKADLDEKTLETLSEYGDIGEIVQALVLQNKQLIEGMNKGEQGATRTQEQEESVDPVQVQVDRAIAGNADLSDWQKNDQDKWDMAVIVDNQLRNDPNYRNATFEDRFAEAARRTKLAFGLPVDDPGQGDESLADKANKAVQEAAKSQHPSSLTDVGRAPAQMKSRVDSFAEMNEAQLAAAMEGMSEEQIEQIMAELG